MRRTTSLVHRLIASAMMLAVFAATTPTPALAQTATKSYNDPTRGFGVDTTFLASGAQTATGNTGTAQDVGTFANGNILVDVTAVTGTTPTLTVIFQSCSDAAGTKCAIHTASVSITAVGTYLIKVNNFGHYANIGYVIG